MTVSLVGLPGSGKTTLCRTLATELDFRPFVLGDALRQRAAVHGELQEALSRGDMAPEPLVLDLVKTAAIAARDTGLILDGFPRHTNQIDFAKSTFTNWAVLYLDVDIKTALSRLQARFICGICGFVRSSALEEKCPMCSGVVWVRRSEDAPNMLRGRLEAFQEMLASMLGELRDVAFYRIDARRSAGEVFHDSLLLLRPARHCGSL